MYVANKGYLITLEGIEGSGKSSHARFIVERLQQIGKNVLLTREPGGTDTGEKIRDILLDKDLTQLLPETELLLLFAARVQHIQQTIMPAMNAGRIVICDRFIDSSYAYQGGGRKIPMAKIKQLEDWIFAELQPEFKPDLTLLLDLPVEDGLSRARGMRLGLEDRFEAEDISFFVKVRETFLSIAKNGVDRIYMIDATQDLKSVQLSILKILAERGIRID